MNKTLQLFSQIQTLRERYYRAAVDKEALLKLIYETEVAEQVYNSNAIENSTLTLEETEKILRQIDLDRFINEREMFEAKNLARVVEYIHQKAAEKELTLNTILLLHKMLISNIRDGIAGRFRNEDEWVRVGNHIASGPNEIISQLTEMLVTYQGNNQEHIIKRVSKVHLTFEHIHPFVDGNGRIGRVINNLLLNAIDSIYVIDIDSKCAEQYNQY